MSKSWSQCTVFPSTVVSVGGGGSPRKIRATRQKWTSQVRGMILWRGNFPRHAILLPWGSGNSIDSSRATQERDNNHQREEREEERWGRVVSIGISHPSRVRYLSLWMTQGPLLPLTLSSWYLYVSSQPSQQCPAQPTLHHTQLLLFKIPSDCRSGGGFLQRTPIKRRARKYSLLAWQPAESNQPFHFNIAKAASYFPNFDIATFWQIW